MKLHITTGDDECELSQIVNTNKMLQDRLDGQETDIPVMRLYEFIKEKTGRIYSRNDFKINRRLISSCCMCGR